MLRMLAVEGGDGTVYGEDVEGAPVREQTGSQTRRAGVRASWLLPVVAALVTWLLWWLVAEGFLFAPGITTRLLGVSVAANVGLLTYLATSRR